MADGTAPQCGRVGSCHILLSLVERRGFFCAYYIENQKYADFQKWAIGFGKFRLCPHCVLNINAIVIGLSVISVLAKYFVRNTQKYLETDAKPPTFASRWKRKGAARGREDL